MMRQQDRLRRLQMGLAGHDRRRVGGGLSGQRADDLEAAVGDPSDGVAQPDPKQRGHLVVSRPARPQPSAQLCTDPVDEAAFQRAVHVLVGDQWQEAAVGDVVGQAVQADEQSVALLFGEQPGPKQYPRVGF